MGGGKTHDSPQKKPSKQAMRAIQGHWAVHWCSGLAHLVTVRVSRCTGMLACVTDDTQVMAVSCPVGLDSPCLLLRNVSAPLIIVVKVCVACVVYVVE